MLHTVEIYNDQNEVLSLPLETPVQGISLVAIDGLDPVEATFITSDFAVIEGEEYQGANTGGRDINLKVGFDLGYTSASVQSRRDLFNKFLRPKKPVKMVFKRLGKPDVYIDGRSRDVQAPLFMQDPEAVASIRCFKSPFISEIEKTHTGTASTTNQSFTLNYPADEETGVLFSIYLPDAIGLVRVEVSQPNGATQVMTLQSNFQVGDYIEVNTKDSEKGVWVTSLLGERRKLLSAFAPGSDWIKLKEGANNIVVYKQGTPAGYDMVYRERFGAL